MDKTWRDAKIPKWAVENIEDEFAALKLTAALSWPTEPRPTPLPFCWVEYDQLIGVPDPGVYWTERGEKFELRLKEGATPTGWKAWEFRTSGSKWSTHKTRGRLFDNERDARLWMLWDASERAAKELMRLRADVSTASP